MQKIYQNICDIFPEINWEVLNNTNYPRIRFYFDDTKGELLEVQKLSTAIINDIFDGNPIFIAITFFLRILR